jgi:hypothetical protein
MRAPVAIETIAKRTARMSLEVLEMGGDVRTVLMRGS